MAQYRKESHIRSILKGISWRIVATIDTVVVVALVTALFSKEGMNLCHAFKIGFAEFFIKFAVYYIHERVWEQYRTGDGLDKSRTLKKAVSWRIVATTMTFVIAGVVLQAFSGVAAAIAAIEFVSKFVLYYVHERIWLKLPLGRIRNWLFRRKVEKRIPDH